jgi:hypothetical protein
VGGVARAAHELAQGRDRARVERVQELIEVDDLGRVGGRDLAVVGDLRLVVGPGEEGDVAAGDARQRRVADRRLRALVQGGDLFIQLELELGEVVVAELDRLDRADGNAADLDLVPGDELPGVVDYGAYGVGVVGEPKHHPSEQDHGGDQRRDREHPRPDEPTRPYRQSPPSQLPLNWPANL